MGKSHPHRITRRQFLAGAALARGREQGATSTVPVSTSTSTAATAAVTPTPALAPVVPTALPERAADLVLLNGKIITVDPSDTISQALAVKGGLIQAVGTDDEIAASIGEATTAVADPHRDDAGRRGDRPSGRGHIPPPTSGAGSVDVDSQGRISDAPLTSRVP